MRSFNTNQFGHPYHRSQFYSAFRANGYSFWQSVPGTFVGSYLWETFSGVQAPAPNDLINTGFGGIVLGEMTFRLSQKIVDNRRHGSLTGLAKKWCFAQGVHKIDFRHTTC